MVEETFLAAIVAETALVKSAVPTAIVEAGERFRVDLAIEKAKSISENWVIEIPFMGEFLDQMAQEPNVTIFKVGDLSPRLFATNQQLAPGKCHVIAQKGVIGQPLLLADTLDDSAVPKQRVTRVFKTGEERYVLGVVLVPETADSQGDIYSHDEVRKAAHGYMEHAGALGKQHSEIVTGRLKILESYVAPVDFQVEEESVAKGTWLLGIRVVDDDLWDGIKKGDFTGFSIGGAAWRHPEV